MLQRRGLAILLRNGLSNCAAYGAATGVARCITPNCAVKCRRLLHCYYVSAHSGTGAAAAASSKSTSGSSAVSGSSASRFSPPFRTVLFASSDFSLPTLRSLTDGGSAADLISGKLTVVTPCDKPRARGKKVLPSEVKVEALKLGCNVVDLPTETKFNMQGWELPAELRNSVDLGIVVSFGYKLPERLISLFPAGVLNIHPSLLPAYRGAAPIQFALAHGEKQTGVSIIDVHPTRIDGGDILSQETTPLPSSTSYSSIAPVLAQQGARQLEQVLRNFAQSRSQARSQSNPPPADSTNAISAPSSAPRIPKSAGQLLFSLDAPQRLFRIWAALEGFLPLYSTFHGERIAIQTVLHPDDAQQKLQHARENAAKLPPPTEGREHVNHFPTIEEALKLGTGGLFYEPLIGAVGVICAGSTPTNPQVLYVTQLMVAFKSAPVSAETFARGYLDKRRIKADLHDTWRFLSTEEGPTGGRPLKEIDFWGPKLNKKSDTPALPSNKA
jgi:methionyl-tRNA formyltransferase